MDHLIGGDVGRDRADDVVGLARHQIAVADFRMVADGRLEPAHVVVSLLLQRDLDIGDDAVVAVVGQDVDGQRLAIVADGGVGMGRGNGGADGRLIFKKPLKPSCFRLHRLCIGALAWFVPKGVNPATALG